MNGFAMRMRRALILLPALAAAMMLLAPLTVDARQQQHVRKQRHAQAAAKINFRGTVAGPVIGFRPAGMQPDFDLIDRVVIKTTIRRRFGPPMTLVLDSYVENFSPYTTPTLIDLIHPGKYVSTTLGGFFTGRAIVTDRSGTVLYDGLMLMEAFKFGPNGLPGTTSEVNHLIIRDAGQGVAKSGVMNLDSILVLHILPNKQFRVTGTIWGHARIPPPAAAALRRPGNGSGGLSLTDILKQFQVSKPAQRGGAIDCKAHPQYCLDHNNKLRKSSGSKSTGLAGILANVKTNWRMYLGISFIGLAVVLLIVFFWQERGRGKRVSAVGSASPTSSSGGAD